MSVVRYLSNCDWDGRWASWLVAVWNLSEAVLLSQLSSVFRRLGFGDDEPSLVEEAVAATSNMHNCGFCSLLFHFSYTSDLHFSRVAPVVVVVHTLDHNAISNVKSNMAPIVLVVTTPEALLAVCTPLIIDKQEAAIHKFSLATSWLYVVSCHHF